MMLYNAFALHALNIIYNSAVSISSTSGYAFINFIVCRVTNVKCIFYLRFCYITFTMVNLKICKSHFVRPILCFQNREFYVSWEFSHSFMLQNLRNFMKKAWVFSLSNFTNVFCEVNLEIFLKIFISFFYFWKILRFSVSVSSWHFLSILNY